MTMTARAPAATAKARGSKADDGNARANQAWMVIFADLLALLLTFFVMIFSMNAVLYEDWQSVVDALTEQLNPIRARVSEEAWEAPDATRSPNPYGISLNYLNTVLDQKLREDPVLDASTLHRLSDRLVVSLPAEMAFRPGRATLTPEGRRAIGRLGDSLRPLRNRILVAGHTVVSPIGNADYPSNWELSIDRAASVARVLAESGHPQPIITLGYADTRFSDLDPTRPMPERYRLARRVDVIVLELRRIQGRDDRF